MWPTVICTYCRFLLYLSFCPSPLPLHLQGVGEPPLFLAASVFFAIKDAIRSFRKEQGDASLFELWAPATAERIRMACRDQFTEMVCAQTLHGVKCSLLDNLIPPFIFSSMCRLIRNREKGMVDIHLSGMSYHEFMLKLHFSENK